MEHFRDAFTLADVDGALAASVFHKGLIPIPELKRWLKTKESPSVNNQAVDNALPLAERLDWAKCEGMIPAIVQHSLSGEVLMQGFMTREALEKTQTTGQVTFFSRSKQRLWTRARARAMCSSSSPSPPV